MLYLYILLALALLLGSSFDKQKKKEFDKCDSVRQTTTKRKCRLASLLDHALSLLVAVACCISRLVRQHERLQRMSDVTAGGAVLADP